MSRADVVGPITPVYSFPSSLNDALRRTRSVVNEISSIDRDTLVEVLAKSIDSPNPSVHIGMLAYAFIHSKTGRLERGKITSADDARRDFHRICRDADYHRSSMALKSDYFYGNVETIEEIYLAFSVNFMGEHPLPR